MGGRRVVRLWGGMGRCGPTLNPSITSSALFSAICCNQRSVAGQQRGEYIEEAADSANHEAGLVEACDACGGIAGGAADEVCAGARWPWQRAIWSKGCHISCNVCEDS